MLVDISYYAIKCSNDFRAKIPSEHDFLNLYSEFIACDEQFTASHYEKYEDQDKLFYILFGLSQKSFWFQEIHRLASMNTRFYHLLYEIPKNHADLPQFYLQVENRYGVDFATYNLGSMVLWNISTDNIYFRFPYNLDIKLQDQGIDNKGR
ncbi:unnamed protein product, partial [marine sediment metagenome]